MPKIATTTVLHPRNYNLFNKSPIVCKNQSCSVSPNFTTYKLLCEVMQVLTLEDIIEQLSIHSGTVKRWIKNHQVPDNYFNDLNGLINNKYLTKNTYREKDQFYTNKKISQYCYAKTLEVLQDLEINTNSYTFIEPSAGCCNFYEILPTNKRIGIDIEPKGKLASQLIKSNYLDYTPSQYSAQTLSPNQKD